MIWIRYGSPESCARLLLTLAVQYEKSLGEDSPDLRLVESVERNAHHYIELFSRAVDKAMPEPRSEPK